MVVIQIAELVFITTIKPYRGFFGIFQYTLRIKIKKRPTGKGFTMRTLIAGILITMALGTSVMAKTYYYDNGVGGYRTSSQPNEWAGQLN